MRVTVRGRVQGRRRRDGRGLRGKEEGKQQEEVEERQQTRKELEDSWLLGKRDTYARIRSPSCSASL